MKFISLLLISIAVLVICSSYLVSCKEEDKSYYFEDRTLSGKIGNIEWMYSDGYAEVTENEIFINLFPYQEQHQGCNVFIAKSDEAFFILPNEVGLHKLNGDLASSARAITLLDFDEATNHMATRGAVEITSISSDHISGRVDALADQQNFVRGNFSISICR